LTIHIRCPGWSRGLLGGNKTKFIDKGIVVPKLHTKDDVMEGSCGTSYHRFLALKRTWIERRTSACVTPELIPPY